MYDALSNNAIGGVLSVFVFTYTVSLTRQVATMVTCPLVTGGRKSYKIFVIPA